MLIKMEFSSNLRLKRKQFRLTQKKASALIGVDVKRYAKWEEGKSEPSIRHHVKICEVFRVDDLYLFIKNKVKTPGNEN